MADWRTCKLGELLDIKHGFAFSGEHFADSGTHIVLTPGNFFDAGGFKHKGDKEKWYRGPIRREYVLAEGDLIVAMTEQAEGLLGSSALVPRGGLYLHNQRLGLVQLRDPERTSKHFVYNLFNSSGVRQQIRASASGAKIRHTAPSRIAEVIVDVPPLAIQHRIASILTVYDELIENSQRRIEILESIARALYREWFVHFRFPGHEAVTKIQPTPAEVPLGWEERRLGTAFQIVLGGTPSRANAAFWNGGTIAWINSGKVNDLRITEASEYITPLALERSAAKLMPIGTTVLAITGATLGQVSRLEIETAANQSVVGIVDPSGRWSEWIYLTIRERIEEIINHASGGAQQHINKEIVSDVPVILPPVALADRFREHATPIFREIANLLFQVRNLRRTRDLLLPRLLSGQIDVESIPA